MANIQPRIAVLGDQKNTRHTVAQHPTLASNLLKKATLLQEQIFHSMLTLERRRAERSRNSFVLMLLDAGASETSGHLMSQVASVLSKSTRETDLVGWYKTAWS